MAKNIIEELKRCGEDPVYFIENYVKIQHPKRGTLPFHMYDFQRKSVEDFADHRFNIVLKSRQLGYSTVTAAYCLWAALFYEDKAIVVVATKLETARTFFKKVKFAWDKLDPMFKRLTQAVNTTKTEITFSNGSFVKAVTTGDDVGRSEALSMLVVDEAAFINNFEEVYSQAYPTLSTGGRCVILSTPGPIGNFYHKLWVDAEKKKNELNPIKLPWHVHPDRDEKWFRTTKANMTDEKFEREYNCSFDGAEANFFSLESINEVKAMVQNPNAIVDEHCWVWKGPEKESSYVIAADVARGDGGDYSTMMIVDVESGEVVLEDRRHERPQDYARRAVKLAEEYNGALICPEQNTYGWTMIDTIRDEGYKNVYFERLANWHAAQNGDFKSSRAGFSTQTDSRITALIRLEDALTTGAMKFRSQRFLEEMQTFIKGQTSTGKPKPQAVKGKHDDLVMCAAIASYVLYQVRNSDHGECLSYNSGSGDQTIIAALAKARQKGTSPLLEAIGNSTPRRIVSNKQSNGFIRRGHDPRVAELQRFMKSVMR